MTNHFAGVRLTIIILTGAVLMHNIAIVTSYVGAVVVRVNNVYGVVVMCENKDRREE